MPEALSERAAKLVADFDQALGELEETPSFAKPNHQQRCFDLALRLIKLEDGVAPLVARAHRLEVAGVFAGSDWARAEHLQPGFVASSLAAGGATLAVELLSELRFLAILRKEQAHDAVSPADARAFLEEVLALNVDRLFPSSDEVTRSESPTTIDAVRRFFLQLAGELGPSAIVGGIVDEIDRILAQRPIRVDRAVEMLRAVRRMAEAEPDAAFDERGRQLLSAEEGASPTAAANPDPEAYRAAIADRDAAALADEARVLGEAMWLSGLVCPQHAVLLREVAERAPEHVATALGLGPLGRAALENYQSFVVDLIRAAIRPSTAQAVYGLACLLTGGAIFFPPVPSGLRRLQQVPILSRAVEQLRGDDAGADFDPRAALIAGTIQVLGQPLGVGQGDNPTCQSARAISLWAQVDPGFLLDILIQAVVHGQILTQFEGTSIRSREAMAAAPKVFDMDLDPVSRVLVPHLDAVYARMSELVVGRGEDGHKWINPEFHGWWNCRGFAIAVNFATGAIHGFDDFCRLFHACYHPDYCGAFPLAYPQPAGIASTNCFGRFVGWHAVTIERVDRDGDGVVRVYFYNPNNDGGQRWGPELVTSTHGHGEFAGESSLPFADFAARCYLFHYHEHDHGDPAVVPEEEVLRIRLAVAGSWGAEKQWLGAVDGNW